MPPGQATKRRSTTSMSEANLVELPTASPVDAFASLSPVDASPSSQTVDIGSICKACDAEVKGLKEEVASLKGIIQSYEGHFEQFEHFMRQMQGNGSGYDSFDE
ncbi:unnamed protein product [Camellia sinensis]